MSVNYKKLHLQNVSDLKDFQAQPSNQNKLLTVKYPCPVQFRNHTTDGTTLLTQKYPS
jgi:hypothetical protein